MSEYNTQPEMPMKWHKFLIYFSLWAGMVVHVVNALMLFTGTIYGSQGDAQMVYMVFRSLKSTDTIFAILYLCLAAYTIYTRFQLAGFKAGAPGKLTALYVLSLLISLAYVVVISGITGMRLEEAFSSNTVSSLISSVVMIVANSNYYSKRAHLFVN